MDRMMMTDCYSWDYDESFDIFFYDTETDKYTNLTNVRGYDAEGSVSPDGKWVVFTSNRRAYDGAMTESEAARFKHDPAVMLDLYRMKSDGTGVQRLTDGLGYDGGPFFSPDGKQLAWTSNRTRKQMSQIFFGEWTHQEARKRLGLTKGSCC